MQTQQFQLKYGKEKFTINIQKDNLLGVLHNKKLPPLKDPKKEIIKSLEHPIASEPLRLKARPGQKIVIIISDITREVRNDIMIPVLIKYLNDIGIKDEDITIVSATGTHRKHTYAEKIKLVGEEILERITFVDHSCSDSPTVYLGKTTRQTPIYINQIVYDADVVILTGGIVYHSMAGFGGGRKSICPGVCAEETIQKNHKLMLNPEKGKGLHSGVAQGLMDNNPMSLDMIEIAEKISPEFLLNVVVNDEGKIGKVFAGDYIIAHQKGCEFIEEFYSQEISRKADLVLASCGGFPKDINLYQASKSIENAALAVKDGGVLVLLAYCNEGIGNSQFYEILAKYKTLEAKEEALREDFTIARGAAYLSARIMDQGKKIILISQLEDDVVEEMGMIPAANLDQAYDIARKFLGNSPSLYIIPHASTLVPVFREI